MSREKENNMDRAEWFAYLRTLSNKELDEAFALALAIATPEQRERFLAELTQ